MRPEPTEYAPFYAGYVSQVSETDVLKAVKSQLDTEVDWWNAIPQAASSTVHPPYTWSVHQVLRHLVDGERIFGYRLLRVAREDSTPLEGFDEDHYAIVSEVHPAPLRDVIDEFKGLRLANYLLLKNLPDDAWLHSGLANGSTVTVRALAYILVGHVRHHDRILRQRLGRQ